MDSYVTDIDALLDQFEKDDLQVVGDESSCNKENEVMETLRSGATKEEVCWNGGGIVEEAVYLKNADPPVDSPQGNEFPADVAVIVAENIQETPLQDSSLLMENGAFFEDDETSSSFAVGQTDVPQDHLPVVEKENDLSVEDNFIHSASMLEPDVAGIAEDSPEEILREDDISSLSHQIGGSSNETTSSSVVPESSTSTSVELMVPASASAEHVTAPVESGFSWRSTDDISDADLERFLEEIISSPDDGAQLPTFSDWTSYPSASTSKEEEADDENIRLSPPIQLSPPIPMSLVDVSDEVESDLLSSSSVIIPETSSTEDASASRLHENLVDISPSISVPVEEELIPEIDETESVASEPERERDFSDENAVAPNQRRHEVIIFSADNLGKLKPDWVPDELAPICMLCGTRFSLVKRRHHCRACGTVICSSCGNYKAKLEYLEFREDRVCALCNETFEYKSGNRENADDSVNDAGEGTSSPSTVIVESHSNRSNQPLPPGLLKRPDRPRNPEEQKSVVFFDGIRPGGDLMESQFHGNGRRLAVMNAKRQRRSPGAPADASSPPKGRSLPKRSSSSHVVRLFVNREVFPVMDLTKDGHYVLHDHPDMQLLKDKFSGCPSEPVDFFVNACLRVSVQLIELKCCTGQVVWSFTTSGMRLVGQDEVVILLLHQEGDSFPPRDILLHLNEIFLHAKEGRTIGALGHSVVGLSGYSFGFLGNRNNAGFLFVRRSFQCIATLRLPEPPYLFGILMNKWEIPWAKLFPIRLMLRLGAEFRYYPCPLVSYRNRKPVYEEVGHTLMNLLCDFRNFQYHLPCVEDSECCMEKGTITLRFPKYKYDQVVKACQSSNENVLPIGMDLSRRADASLVCIQNLETGQYDTQAISIENNERKVTGASFVIFNASLKSVDGSECRATVVEDGIMAQVTMKGLQDLKSALKAMRSITFKPILDPKSTSPGPHDVLTVEWIDAKSTCNSGVKSPIDGRDMSGIESRRVTLKHSMDFVNGTLCVRCTEVFLADQGPTNAVYREELDLSRLAENLAMATCSVLRNHLYDYRDSATTKIGLRVTLAPDFVQYDLGSKGEHFAADVLMEYDDKIMPLINEYARMWNDRPQLDLELIFRIFQH